MLMGGALIFTSFAGKGFIRLYRAVKLKNAFGGASYTMGKAYKGSFEGTMSRREAALILGIRYVIKRLIIYLITIGRQLMVRQYKRHIVN